MNYPTTQIEFEKLFSTEEQCQSYLTSLRYENGYLCEKCNCTEFWVNNRGVYICKFCKNELSITAGTIFHGARIPLTLLFRALWYIVTPKNGVSAVSVQNILGLKRYTTTWIWLQRFRRLMVLPGREKLSGVVEVDETLVGGKRSGKRGRGAEGKTLVIIAVELVEKHMGRVRLSTIEYADRICINKFIKDNIDIGSTIITDGWKGYTDLKKMKYKHITEDKKVKLNEEEITPNVHKIASLLKRWLLGTHQNFTSSENLNYYLDEYAFRYNRRRAKSRGYLFYVLLKQAVLHKPVSECEILKTELKQ